MAFDAGSVIAHVKADVSDFKRGMGQARDEVEQTSAGVSNFGGVLKTALIAGGAIAAGGMILLGKSALEAAGNFEQTKISFEVMLGSAAKATKLLAELQDFAKKTPFNLVELQDSTKRLLAYGVAGDEVIDTMTMLGNVTSGVGRDKLPQLILAFGQVKAAGRLMGTELRQFTETGVPMIQLLADHFHVARSEIQDMVKDGKVGFKDVEAALQSLGGEGGKWGDLMDRQSKTMQGSLSNLQDSWTQLLVVLGTMFIPATTQVIQVLTSFISPIQAVMQGTKSLSEVFGLTGEQTKTLNGILEEFRSFIFDTLMPAVGAVVSYMVTQWNLHKDQFAAAWMIIWGIIQFVWALIYGLLKVGLELLAGDWDGAWKAIVQMTNNAWGAIKNIFQGALNFMGSWAGEVFDNLVSPFRNAWNEISKLVNKIKDALDFTKRHSPSVVDIVNKGVNEVNRAMSNLDFGVGDLSPHAQPNFAPVIGGGSGGGSINSVTIDLSGAIISDEQAAMRIGEKIGDSIIKKLGSNVRF